MLTFLLIIVLIGLLVRLLFPVFLRSAARKMAGNNPNSGEKRNGRGNVAYKKGETTVVSHGEERSEVPKDFGDYTDYEEIKNE